MTEAASLEVFFIYHHLAAEGKSGRWKRSGELDANQLPNPARPSGDVQTTTEDEGQTVRVSVSVPAADVQDWMAYMQEHHDHLMTTADSAMLALHPEAIIG